MSGIKQRFVGSFIAVALAALAGTAAAAGASERVVITFKPQAGAAGRAELAKQGGRIQVDLAEVNAVAVTLPRTTIDRLRQSKFVAKIEPDGISYPTALASPSAPPYQPGQLEPYGIRMVQADQLPGTNASNRTLCIVDSGYEAAHEDLAGNIVNGETFTGSGPWNTDEVGHGTHVGGTISALDQRSVGVVGVLPHAKLNLYIAKVFPGNPILIPNGGQFNSVIALAALHCRRAGANVISMSLGGAGSAEWEFNVYRALEALNVLVVAAAGNAGDTTTSFPAGYPSVMSVAAVDANMAHAGFSQTNADVEISGPGVQVLSTVPMGSGRDTSLTVGGTAFSALATDGPTGSASAALYNFGTGEVDDPGVAGKMCLIQRGNISFADKVTRCQNNGGVGAVIYNNQPGVVSATLGGAPVTIPSATVTQADGTTLLGLLGQTASLSITTSNYAYFNGTSMATPHVSAVAALVWSYYPNCPATAVREALNKSALDLGDPGRDDVFGNGLVQAKAAYDYLGTLGCGAPLP